VEKEGEVMHEKGGGIFVQYKYLPRMTLLYHKTYRKNAIPNNLGTPYFQIFPLGANYGGASWAPQSKISRMFFSQCWQL
jgi:hypothetical protein